MASITKQLDGLLNLKWVRKHFYTTSPHTEGSLQKCPCQCSGHKVVRSVRSNRSPPGTVDDQTELETSHEEAYQYHHPSDKIWHNPMPGPKETNENIKPRLQKKEHPAFLFPAKLQLLEPPLPPLQNKPLPEIPTQARPREIPDRVGRKVQDPRPPARNPPNTTRKAVANYSPFPELSVVPPPRSSSLQYSSRPYRKTHKPQGLPCVNTTVTKQLDRHVAELYQDPSMERENAVKELRDVSIEELLPRVTRSPSVQKRVIGSGGQNLIHPLNEVVTDTEVEVAHSSSRSLPGLAIVSPLVEYNWNKNTPIVFESSSRNLRRATSSEHFPKATTPLSQYTAEAPETYLKGAYDHNHRPTMVSQRTRSNLTTRRGRRPIGASLEVDTKISSVESGRRESLDISPKIAPCERRASIVLRSSRSANHLSMHKSESCPRFTKKSVPNFRRAAKYEPLQLHQFPQPPRPLRPAQPPWVDNPVRSVFHADDEDKYSRFDFLCIYRLRSSKARREARRLNKNNPLSFKWCRAKID